MRPTNRSHGYGFACGNDDLQCAGGFGRYFQRTPYSVSMTNKVSSLFTCSALFFEPFGQ